ncbi:hypothetical protein GW916_00715 [bacterium]|nr:hypothetical protein [bacterium]
MRNKFKIASNRQQHYLFPIPVIEDKKFLIETESLNEAQLLQRLLEAGWIVFNDEAPSEFWMEEGLHADGRTRRYTPDWSKLVLSYFPRDLGNDEIQAEKDEFKMTRLEKVVSKALSELIQYQSQSDDQPLSQSSGEVRSDDEQQLLEKLKNKIQAQKNCRTCQSLGIAKVDFSLLFNRI